MARGDQASLRRASSVPTDDVAVRPASRPFRLDDVLLLDPLGNQATAVGSIFFSDEGIGVVEQRGQPPRVLPWSSVSAHVVEAWTGGIVPEWWVDPELDREPGLAPRRTVTASGANARTWPEVDTGALLGIKTASATYRFLLPETDPAELSRRVNEIAVVHRGPGAAAGLTTLAADRDTEPPEAEERSAWSKVQPFLVVALVLFIATAVTLILLQSAGTIHLPFLGGANSGSLGPTRTAVPWLRTS